MSPASTADRSGPGRDAALEARVLARLDATDVTDVTLSDRGVVPHGDFRAWMIRANGALGGQAWSARITATFATRPAGRFYVEIAATSGATDFVARRGCFDAVTAAVTIHRERR